MNNNENFEFTRLIFKRILKISTIWLLAGILNCGVNNPLVKQPILQKDPTPGKALVFMRFFCNTRVQAGFDRITGIGPHFHDFEWAEHYSFICIPKEPSSVEPYAGYREPEIQVKSGELVAFSLREGNYIFYTEKRRKDSGPQDYHYGIRYVAGPSDAAYYWGSLTFSYDVATNRLFMSNNGAAADKTEFAQANSITLPIKGGVNFPGYEPMATWEEQSGFTVSSSDLSCKPIEKVSSFLREAYKSGCAPGTSPEISKFLDVQTGQMGYQDWGVGIVFNCADKKGIIKKHIFATNQERVCSNVVKEIQKPK